ncbi:unnamed protein product [Brugia timori]|uniref:Uncharacterized protein n=1 Tax=Brugia timori TaxID=42155 RepID=A0A0R3R4I0_9BILA|nr:unnamed protein product [Brugia timori]
MITIKLMHFLAYHLQNHRLDRYISKLEIIKLFFN